jgi:hypothetical protein
MSSLSNELKELIFDYCIGQGSPEQNKEAEALIHSNTEAAQIYSDLKSALKPLGSMEIEDCPSSLVEQTVYFVNDNILAGQNQLQKLLANEQAAKASLKTTGFWHNFSEMAAVAAAVLLIIGVLVPTMGVARQKYMKNLCQAQFNNIFMGFNNYVNDHDGRQPAVKTASGAPWYKVGNQGDENHSNTRHIFLLVKGNYADIHNFACPGNRKTKNSQITPAEIQRLKDFPDRSFVTYSFRISCVSKKDGQMTCRKVILADLNPLFEVLSTESSQSFNVQLERKLLTVNSINHKRRGQNVLFGDGSVDFLKTRHMNLTEDDIFTLQDTDIYQGSEVPSSPTDSFLAP